MSFHLEKEKKFLIKLPTSWSVLASLFEYLVDVKRITQTYMVAKPGEQAARIRKTVEGPVGHTKTIFHFNQKQPVEHRRA